MHPSKNKIEIQKMKKLSEEIVSGPLKNPFLDPRKIRPKKRFRTPLSGVITPLNGAYNPPSKEGYKAHYSG